MSPRTKQNCTHWSEPLIEEYQLWLDQHPHLERISALDLIWNDGNTDEENTYLEDFIKRWGDAEDANA